MPTATSGGKRCLRRAGSAALDIQACSSGSGTRVLRAMPCATRGVHWLRNSNGFALEVALRHLDVFPSLLVRTVKRYQRGSQ